MTAFWSPTVALATVEGDERSCVRQTLIGQFAGVVPTFAYEFDEQARRSIGDWTAFTRTGDPFWARRYF